MHGEPLLRERLVRFGTDVQRVLPRRQESDLELALAVGLCDFLTWQRWGSRDDHRAHHPARSLRIDDATGDRTGGLRRRRGRRHQ